MNSYEVLECYYPLSERGRGPKFRGSQTEEAKIISDQKVIFLS